MGEPTSSDSWEGRRPATTRRDLLLFAAKTIASAALLVLLLRRLQISRTLAVLAQADSGFLLWALLADGAFVLIRAYKWFLIVRRFQERPAFLPVLRAYAVGICIGALTPGRIGEIARIGRIGCREMAGPSVLFLFDRFVDLLVVFLMATLGLYCGLGQRMLALVVATVCLVVLASMFWLRTLPGILEPVVRRLPLGARFSRMLDALTSMDRGVMIIHFLLTIASYIVVTIVAFFALRAFRPVGFMPVVMVHPLVMATHVLPITVGGLGLRETASVVLYGRFGIEEAQAFWAGFLVFALNIVVCLVLAAGLGLLQRRRPGGEPARPLSGLEPAHKKNRNQDQRDQGQDPLRPGE